jgi:hypothetical protein
MTPALVEQTILSILAEPMPDRRRFAVLPAGWWDPDDLCHEAIEAWEKAEPGCYPALEVQRALDRLLASGRIQRRDRDSDWWMVRLAAKTETNTTRELPGL